MVRWGWVTVVRRVLADAIRYSPVPGCGAALSAGALPLPPLHAPPVLPSRADNDETARLVLEREFWSAYLSMNHVP
jgi:hypothetical protein